MVWGNFSEGLGGCWRRQWVGRVERRAAALRELGLGFVVRILGLFGYGELILAAGLVMMDGYDLNQKWGGLVGQRVGRLVK